MELISLASAAEHVDVSPCRALHGDSRGVDPSHIHGRALLPLLGVVAPPLHVRESPVLEAVTSYSIDLEVDL